MKADPKSKKRTKASAAPAAGRVARAVAEAPQPHLPDLEYVEQLLLDSADDSDATQTVAAADEVVETEMSEPPIAPVVIDANGMVTLPAQCLLRDASEGKQQLLPYLEAPVVTIDVAAVERIDTAYLQVLLSFVRSRSPQQTVVWANVGPLLDESAKTLGLHVVLGLPELSEAA